MIINPLGALFNKYTSYLRTSRTPLQRDSYYYVLDLDDLTVEHVSYDTIFSAIVDYGIIFANVVVSDEDDLYLIREWSFFDDKYTSLGCGFYIYNSRYLQFKDEKLVFELTNKVNKCVLLLNGRAIFETDKLVHSSGIHYLYKVGNYFVIRLSIIPVGVDKDIVLAIILDDKGSLVCVEKNQGYGEVLFKSKDEGFSSKFNMLYGGRY